MVDKYFRNKTILFTIVIISLWGCKGSEVNYANESQMLLTQEIAENLSKLPLKCLQKEYPNKLNQTLGSSSELMTPQALHPAFYGCFDWHSSVHGHWMLVKLLKKFDLSKRDTIIQILKQQLSPLNIEKEVAYFNLKSEKSFERTYGWAWLLKLQEELDTWENPDAQQLANHLQPLTNLLVGRYIEFLPRLTYPIRSGEHPNTGFGLALAYDYAISSKNDTLAQLIKKRSIDYFQHDVNCPMNWEPGGFDFLSPCLQEADLMCRILPPNELKIWIDKFIPQLKQRDFRLDQAKVSDRTDGKLVHLDGVNFCRAWSLYHIAKKIPEYGHLRAIANQNIKASLPNIADGGYEGEHWLASFAIYALTSVE